VTKSSLKPGRQREHEHTLFKGPKPRQVWHNPTNPDSLRLTTEAYSALVKYECKTCYSFKLNEKMTNLMLLQLDRLMTAPYYIRSRHFLELFGEADAIMLNLHANNLAQYLNTLAES
jgi:hypothetical protein